MSTHLFLQQLQRDISKLVEPFVLKTQNLNIDFLFASHDKLIVSVCTESLNIEKMQDAIIKAHKSHMFAAQSDFKMEKNGGKTLTFLRFIDHLQVSDAKTQTFTIEQFASLSI